MFSFSSRWSSVIGCLSVKINHGSHSRLFFCFFFLFSGLFLIKQADIFVVDHLSFWFSQESLNPQRCLWGCLKLSSLLLHSVSLWGFNVTKICVLFVYRSCCSVGEATRRRWPCWWFVPAGSDSVMCSVSCQVRPVSTELLTAGQWPAKRVGVNLTERTTEPQTAPTHLISIF